MPDIRNPKYKLEINLTIRRVDYDNEGREMYTGAMNDRFEMRDIVSLAAQTIPEVLARMAKMHELLKEESTV